MTNILVFYRPVLRGRDIKRYGYEFAEKYLIATFPSRHYDIDEFPAVRDYLLTFGKKRLEQSGKPGARKKTKHKWFETQDTISYWEDFSKPKIMYSEIVQEPQFYLDKTGEFYPEATTFIMTGSHLEYLLRILHSKLFAFSFKNFYAGGGLGESGYRYKKAFLEQLPVHVPNQEIERDILIISISNIDNFIYQQYNLTKKDIEFIENQ